MAEKKDQDKGSSQDVGEAEVQRNMDEETEQGYRGVAPDPLENRAYSVQGVTSSDEAAKQDRGEGKPPKTEETR